MEGLNVHSWLIVVTFMIVIILVIRPVKIPLPIPNRSSANASSSTPSQQLTTPYEPTTAQTATKRKKFPYHFTLDIASAPVSGVLFLLATQSIHGHTVRNGIVGSPGSGVEPYSVMILFYSLAYICISLDMTGIFQYAAFWISRRGNGGGQRVFLSFFLLSTVMSGLASNDVVVLTMTPFLVYYSSAVDLVTPVAFLMAEIQTANIASMALYIGNITNVIACQAYRISFLEYSAWMLIPCIAAIATCYFMLRINFRHEKYIPKLIRIPDVDPRSFLVDPHGALFGLAVLCCSLACLIGTSFIHVSVWIVTGPFALLTLARDLWFDYHGKFTGPKNVVITPPTLSESDNAMAKSFAGVGVDNQAEQGYLTTAVPEKSIVQPVSILGGEDVATLGDNSSATTSSSSLDPEKNMKVTEAVTNAIAEQVDNPSLLASKEKMDLIHQQQQQQQQQHQEDRAFPQPDVDNNDTTIPTCPITAEKQHDHDQPSDTQTPLPTNAISPNKGRFEQRFPLLHAIAIRMPWAILPFTFSMFILVEGLSESGWISIFATWFTHVVPNYIAAVYAVGFVSVLLCNIFNNVPMTILVARILQHPNFAGSPVATPDVVKGCLFALVVGSNLGACTTLISSLAGLMWDSVLKNKNSSVGFWGFFRWNMGVMPMVIFVALSVVIIELTVIF
ncbi:hypothetical protein BGZ94_008674 [Podila epigama]|nr:hypothetical protein BGZ94_008674 [Podila epigama]